MFKISKEEDIEKALAQYTDLQETAKKVLKAPAANSSPFQLPRDPPPC